MAELRCSLNLHLTMSKKHWEREAMCLMEISSQVGSTKNIYIYLINLSDYKFCACIYFLVGRESVVDDLCHVGLRNMKLGE